MVSDNRRQTATLSQRLSLAARAELNPDRLVPGITSGLVISAIEVALATSFAALVFHGSLAADLPRGIGMALFAAAVGLIVAGLLSSLESTIGGNQDVPSAIMAVMAAAIAGSATASAGATTATVVAVIALTTLAIAFTFTFFGTFKLAGLVRFLPYPVAGGFLAGTGWLLLIGGISLMAGVNLSSGDLPVLMAPATLGRWVPGLVFGALLLWLAGRIRHSLFLPGMIIIGVLLFYGIATLLGVSAQHLSDAGWLLGPFPAGRLWQPFTLEEMAAVDWSMVLRQAPNILAAMALSSIALLLNISSLEVSLKRDVDVNREMRVAGLSNLLAGLGGGFSCYHQLSLSVLADRVAPDSRLPGLVSGIVTAGALLFGGTALGYMPEMIFGGLLVFLGLSFLWEWLVVGWKRLPHIDYAIVLLIVVVIALVGFLEGIALGVLATIILFIVNYSRTEVIKHSLSVANYRSQVTRPAYQRQLLDANGDLARILQLQGFLFFGTAQGLLDRTREWVSATDGTRVRYLLLDFTRVSGLDTTALLSFSKARQLAEASDLTICVAGLSPAIRRQLEAGDFLDEGPRVRAFDTPDRALQWMEEQVLVACAAPLMETVPLLEQLLELDVDRADAEALLGYLERLELPAGVVFIRQGEPADTLYFIESGQVTAQVRREDGSVLRLETMMNGRVVGEIGFYLNKDRSADVVTEAPSVVYHLSRDVRRRIEAENPEAASVLHQLIIRMLSERVNHLVSTVEALQK